MKILQVGSGGWARGWLECIHELPGYELAGIVSRGGPNMEAARERWNIPCDRCFTDYDKALREVECDLVVIVLPHRLHTEYARKAVEAGKNVLIEKPLCDDLDEAKAFLEFMMNRKEKAWVSQNFRFRPQLWQMKASFGNEGIGYPMWADVIFRRGKTNKKGAESTKWQRVDWRLEQTNRLLVEISVHHFDMMRFLCSSDAKTVYARGWTPSWCELPGVQAVMIIIEFENGFMVNYSASDKAIGNQTGYQCDWLVQTDKGSIKWFNDEPNKLELAEEETGEFVENYYFPGLDRKGVLIDIRNQMEGKKDMFRKF